MKNISIDLWHDAAHEKTVSIEIIIDLVTFFHHMEMVGFETDCITVLLHEMAVSLDIVIESL
jgi:hypothetical protein